MADTISDGDARTEHSGAAVRGTRRGCALAALLLSGGLLAGCGGDGQDGGSPAASASRTTPSQATPSQTTASASSSTDGDGHDADGEGAPEVPFHADTRPDTQKPSGDAFGNITQVRIGHHEGFDRVVFEFGGAGTPGWDVRYVDRPVRQGSGAGVDLEGDASLQVTVTGVGYPPDTGVDEYAGPQRMAARDTDIVTEVFFDGTFEGTTVALIGTRSKNPFRVYLLEDPERIVLEVADAH